MSNVQKKNEGIFAEEDVTKGSILGETHRISTATWEWRPIQIPRHSTEPNCVLLTMGNSKHLVTLRYIKKGTELLVNYRRDSDLSRFYKD